ncbi:peptide deformylase [Streptomyces sp. NPDC001339]|uniref:peptide deformylase n=1 Tax=Streptomyces sp. NPDC001339 TaxID=3364563 RepID=UPI0036B001CD
MTTGSGETDEQYEGCLSLFDVRGLVPRPLKITVETVALTGETVATAYERGLARLIHHEIDHLDGLLTRPG